MPNAGPMVNRCFEHQHPEMFGRPEVLPEFPPESCTGAAPMPAGVNSKGVVA